MRKTLLYMLPLAAALASCELEKEIDYDIQYPGDRIVMHGFISQADGVNLVVKKTISPTFSNTNDTISNAKVTLYDNGVAVATLPYAGNRKYDLPADTSIIKLGHYYHITAEVPGMPTATSAPQLIEPSVPIDTLRIAYDDDRPWSNYHFAAVGFRAQEGRGYSLRYCKAYKGEETDNETLDYFSPYDVCLPLASGPYTAALSLVGRFDSCTVSLCLLSPDLAEYLESVKLYEGSRNDPYFERAYPVFSNVSGGYGIVGAYSVSTATVHYVPNEEEIKRDELERQREEEAEAEE